jgi:hypothetical protein
MRPALKVRKPRPVRVTAGALMLAIPSSAVALAAGTADAQSALQVALNRESITFGQSVTATGVAPRAAGGLKLLLELEPSGGVWRTVGSTLVHSNGRFRIVASPRQSGTVRVIPASGATTASARSLSGSSTVPSGAIAASATRRVAVKAALHTSIRSIGGLSGQPVQISGNLLPGKAGRLVLLEGGSGHGWHTIARARTRGSGRFDLRYAAGGTGQQPVRVRFAGDSLNGAAATRASVLTFYRRSLASWYSDGGSTACGFHANYGVANKDLPCGTQVTFQYGGHTVTATVDDRGPYVGGREWDLNQNTAGALGFNGVDTVLSSR